MAFTSVEGADVLLNSIKEKVLAKEGYADLDVVIKRFIMACSICSTGRKGYLNFHEFVALLTRLACIGTADVHSRVQALFDRYDVAGDGYINYEYLAYSLFGSLVIPDGTPALRQVLSRVRSQISRAGLSSLIFLEAALLARSEGEQLPRATAKQMIRSSAPAAAEFDVDAILVEVMRPTAQYSIVSVPDLCFMLRGAMHRRRRAALDAIWESVTGNASAHAVAVDALIAAFKGTSSLSADEFGAMVREVSLGADVITREAWIALGRNVSPLVPSHEAFEDMWAAGFGVPIHWVEMQHLVPGTSVHHMSATNNMGTRSLGLRHQPVNVGEATGVPVSLNQPLQRDFGTVALAPVLGSLRLIENSTKRSIFGAAGVTGSTRGVGLGVSSRLTGLVEQSATVSVHTMRPSTAASSSTTRRF